MSKTTRLRYLPIRSKDAAGVTRLIKALGAFHGEALQTKPAMVRATACGRGKITNILVALAGEKPVGFIEFHYLANYRRAGLFASVDYFFVEEKYRGKGVGFALIRKAVAKALKDGCKALIIGADPANKVSNAYYARMGLELSSRGHFDYRADERKMREILHARNGKEN